MILSEGPNGTTTSGTSTEEGKKQKVSTRTHLKGDAMRVFSIMSACPSKSAPGSRSSPSWMNCSPMLK
jgi:hypothetical protein